MADIRDRGDGAYQLRVEAGYGRDGKPAYKYRTYKASPGMTKKQQEKEAQKQLLKFEEEVRTGQCVSSDMTFAEFTREWMENSDLRPTTRSGYITLLKRIIPAIGHIRLRDLQPKHLREFYKNLAEGGVRQDTKYELCADLKRELKKRGLTMQALSERSGVSLTTLRSSINGHNVRCDIAQKVNAVLKDDIFQPVGGKTVLSGKTQREHHRLISSILHTAVQWDMIPYNPCDRVVPPKATRKKVTALTQEQAAKLLTSLMNAPLKYRTAIVILLYTGMRRSELCGIGWDDIDYENKRINLNKTVKYLPEKGTFIDEMKNESSRRWVPMTDSIATLLREYHKEYLQLRGNLGDRWEETGMVFTNTTGGLLNPCTLYSWFKAFLRKNNLADVSLHALRHTTATLLIGEGVDVVTTASILGHADKSTTLRIYADAIKSKKHEAVEMLENLIDAGV